MKRSFTLFALGITAFAFAGRQDRLDTLTDKYGQSYEGGEYYDDQFAGDYQQGPNGYFMQEEQITEQMPVNQNQQTKFVSDEELRKKIQDLLNPGWFSDDYKNVTFTVNNGDVFIQGTVAKPEYKKDLDEKIMKIKGVRQVSNGLVVAKESSSDDKSSRDFAASPQDKQINDKIRDKLSSGWFSKGYDALIIRTSDGFVVITGTVDSPEDIQKIRERIKGIEGIRTVNTQLNVKNR